MIVLISGLAIPFGILFLVLIVLFIVMTRVFNTYPVPYSGSPADDKIPYETVNFISGKGLKLHAWWIASETMTDKPVLVLVHGWRRNAERMLPYVRALHRDFRLLVFDSRNHGKSESDNFTSMPKFTEDIIAALNYLDARQDVGEGPYGLIGLSMGGGASIYAAAKDKRINKVVTVGAFANPADIMKREYSKRHIPYFPLVYLLFEYFQFRIGERFSHFAPENQIGRSEATFLIVHGRKDTTAPFSHASRLQASAKPGKTELFEIEAAGHSDCHEFSGFWERIKEFFSPQ